MSERATRTKPFTGGTTAMRAGLAAAGIGFLGLGVGFATDRPQAVFSFLAAYGYALAIVLGALAFLTIHNVAGAFWPVSIRRVVEAITATLPLFAVLFGIVVVGADDLYPWTSHEAPAALGPVEAEHFEHLMHHKSGYLNMPFFLVRAVLYFGLWIAVAELLRRWSLRQDATGDEDILVRSRVLSGGAMPALGLTITFASFDWIMSLEPTWFSTAFGVYWFAGGLLGAVALIIVVTHRARSGCLAERVSGSHYHALGKLLFAFTAFWAYIAYFQGFIIYIANKPEEVSWFVPRTLGSWWGVMAALSILHFAVPFVILFSRSLKFRSGAMAFFGVWQLVMGYVDLHWLVLPALHPDGFSPHWLDLASLLAVVGSAVAFGIWRQRGHAIVPYRDPRYEKSIAYRSHS